MTTNEPNTVQFMSAHIWETKKFGEHGHKRILAAYSHAIKQGAGHDDAAAFAGYHHERVRQGGGSYERGDSASRQIAHRYARLRGGVEGLRKSKNYHNYKATAERSLKEYVPTHAGPDQNELESYAAEHGNYQHSEKAMTKPSIKQQKDMISQALHGSTHAEHVSNHGDASIHSYSPKEDVHILRRGFFYTHGGNSQKHADKISEGLTKAGIKHTIVDHGEAYKPFKGGGDTKANSHWWAKVKLHHDEGSTQHGESDFEDHHPELHKTLTHHGFYPDPDQKQYRRGAGELGVGEKVYIHDNDDHTGHSVTTHTSGRWSFEGEKAKRGTGHKSLHKYLLDSYGPPQRQVLGFSEDLEDEDLEMTDEEVSQHAEATFPPHHEHLKKHGFQIEGVNNKTGSLFYTKISPQDIKHTFEVHKDGRWSHLYRKGLRSRTEAVDSGKDHESLTKYFQTAQGRFNPSSSQHAEQKYTHVLRLKKADTHEFRGHSVHMVGQGNKHLGYVHQTEGGKWRSLTPGYDAGEKGSARYHKDRESALRSLLSRHLSISQHSEEDYDLDVVDADEQARQIVSESRGGWLRK